MYVTRLALLMGFAVLSLPGLAESFRCIPQEAVVYGRVQESIEVSGIISRKRDEFEILGKTTKHEGSKPSQLKFAKDFLLHPYENEVTVDASGILKLTLKYAYPKYDNKLVPQRDIACIAANTLEDFPYQVTEYVSLKSSDGETTECKFTIWIRPRSSTLRNCSSKPSAKK